MHKVLKAGGLAAMAMLVTSPLLSADATTFRDEDLRRLNVIEKKVVGLAEAMPAEKYTWRPAEGVMAVSEVFLHIAESSFSTPSVLGVPAPAGFHARGYQQSTTDKTKIITALKESFAHFRTAIEKLSAEDGDKPVKMYGQQMTTRNALLTALEHLSEHLGQSIAYARMNGVVPPWSR